MATVSDSRVLASPGDEPDLIRQIAAGDPGAFELVMRRHNRRLYRLARAVLRDDADAEDALQAVYLSAYRSIARFRGDATLGTWLSRLVLNECFGRVRRAAQPAGAPDRCVAAGLPDRVHDALGGGNERRGNRAMPRAARGDGAQPASSRTADAACVADARSRHGRARRVRFSWGAVRPGGRAGAGAVDAARRPRRCAARLSVRRIGGFPLSRPEARTRERGAGPDME